MRRDARPAWRRVLPLALLALLVGAWIALHPEGRDWRLLSFPVAVILVALLAWDAVRAPKPRAVAAPVLHRHEQVVRELPDPASREHAAALAAYVADGERVDDAARILKLDPQVLSNASSRRKREALLQRALENGDRTP